MRVGICTLQWSDNYGAVLQACALQSHLIQRGHDAKILDVRPPLPLPSLKPWFSYNMRGLKLKGRARQRRASFERFRRHHLRLTPQPLRSNEALRAEATRYDAVICGSDQVWNPRWQLQYDWFPAAYLLECVPPGIRKLSYAASFGFTDCTSLPAGWRERFRAAVTQFDAISVREATGVGLVREFTGRSDVTLVADPTLLIDAAGLRSLAIPPRLSRPYVFTNMLHGLAEQADGWLAADRWPPNMQFLRCDAPDRWPEHGGPVLAPLEWLGAIKDAACVITNSFHAIVMCLRFHTPFIAIPLEGDLAPMNVRLQDTLAEFGLTGRIAPSPALPDCDLATGHWDWAAVDAAADRLRAQAELFLCGSGL